MRSTSLASPFSLEEEEDDANETIRIIEYLQKTGFYKEGEVSFPHKQSAVMKTERDFWEAPAL